MISLVSTNMDINFPSDHVTEVEKSIIVLLVKIYKKYWQLNDLIP